MNNIITPLTEQEATTTCRAVYALNPDGTRRLLRIQQFTEPTFKRTGLVERKPERPAIRFAELEEEEEVTEINEQNVLEDRHRATRRAKTKMFDYIVCNRDLDVFVTLTYDPNKADRESYEDVYAKIRVYLNNRVQRNGLKYVLVPEYHHDGKSIHWHCITNDVLKLIPSGHRNRNGQTVYNVADWTYGFSTAVKIGKDESDRDKVAKYIFKYIGKQGDQKIGGRYYQHGGHLLGPIYVYSNDPSEFDGAGELEPVYHREKSITENLMFSETSFV